MYLSGGFLIIQVHENSEDVLEPIFTYEIEIEVQHVLLASCGKLLCQKCAHLWNCLYWWTCSPGPIYILSQSGIDLLRNLHQLWPQPQGQLPPGDHSFRWTSNRRVRLCEAQQLCLSLSYFLWTVCSLWSRLHSSTSDKFYLVFLMLALPRNCFYIGTKSCQYLTSHLFPHCELIQGINVQTKMNVSVLSKVTNWQGWFAL